ncbi:MAG: hypothetical protein CMP11_07540 [Zetaproteobacteria bacterium]|nr:hypothetical protein [Pseudobdellovibrionaceae bacterium]
MKNIVIFLFFSVFLSSCKIFSDKNQSENRFVVFKTMKNNDLFSSCYEFDNVSDQDALIIKDYYEKVTPKDVYNLSFDKEKCEEENTYIRCLNVSASKLTAQLTINPQVVIHEYYYYSPVNIAELRQKCSAYSGDFLADKLSDKEQIEEALFHLKITFPSTGGDVPDIITKNINLPLFYGDVEVSWISYNPEHLTVSDGEGIVTRSDSEESVQVQLKADLQLGSEVRSRYFYFTIPGLQNNTLPTDFDSITGSDRIRDLIYPTPTDFDSTTGWDRIRNLIYPTRYVSGDFFDEWFTEKDIDLQKGGSIAAQGLRVLWSSSHPNIIGDDGKVFRNEAESYGTWVTLTATVNEGDTYVFSLRVVPENYNPNMQDYFYSIELIDFETRAELPYNSGGYVVKKDLYLPQHQDDSTLTWSSDDPESIRIVGDKGYVFRDLNNKNITLTALILNGENTQEKKFSVLLSPLTMEDKLEEQRYYDNCYLPDDIDESLFRGFGDYSNFRNIISLYGSSDQDGKILVKDLMDSCYQSHREGHEKTQEQLVSDFELFRTTAGSNIYPEETLGNIKRGHELKDFVTFSETTSSPIKVIFMDTEGIEETGMDLGGLRKELFSHLGMILKGEKEVYTDRSSSVTSFKNVKIFKNIEDTDFYSVSDRNDFSEYFVCLSENHQLQSDLEKEQECYKNIGATLARAMIIDEQNIPIKLSPYLIQRIISDDFSSEDLKKKFINYFSALMFTKGGFNSIKPMMILNPPSFGYSEYILKPGLNYDSYNKFADDLVIFGDAWKVSGDAMSENDFSKRRFDVSLEMVKNSLMLPNSAGNENDFQVTKYLDIELRTNALVEGFRHHFTEAIRAEVYTVGFSSITFNKILAGTQLSQENFREIMANAQGDESFKEWIRDSVLEQEEIQNGFIGKFMSFVTGVQSVPNDIETRPIKIFIVGNDINAFPTSHTCFNQLDMPRYNSKDLLKRKLIEAVNGSAGFGQI